MQNVLGLADLGNGRFLSWNELSGAALRFDAPATVRSVRALFHAGASTDTLNSWIRSLRAPPDGALRLQDHTATERRFQVTLAGAALGADGLLIELLLDQPLTLSNLVVLLPPGPYGWMRLTTADTPYEGAPWQVAAAPELPAYPQQQEQLPKEGDPLGTQLLALGEPTLARLWSLAQPYRAAALIGAVEGPIAAVNWDGGLVLERRDGEFDRLWLRLQLSLRGQAEAGDETSWQRLLDGWRPVSVVERRTGELALQQVSFVGLDGQLYVRWTARNTGQVAVALKGELVAARSRLQKADNAPRAMAALHQAVPVRGELFAESEQLPRPLEIDHGGLAGALRGALPTSLAPGAAAMLDLNLALGTKTPLELDQALVALQQDTDAYLRAGATLDLPDPHLQNLWRALLVHNRLFQRGGKMRYGLFPGAYEDGLFGVEEGWNLQAMAFFGHGAEAHALLAQTFFDAEFLKKEGQHHQYRNGLAPFYALEIFRLTGDRGAITALAPTLLDSARWIRDSLRSTRVEVQGERPPYYGLMPRHTYGGDLTEPTYSLYGSSACWRGLRDAGLSLQELGHAEAAPLLEEAARARRDMREAAAALFRHGASPPYLPFRADQPGEGRTEQPSEGDYYQLFSSLILETALFGWRGRMSREITDYLEQTGRLVLGVARFDQWFGRLGVDAEYSRGVQLAHLHRRDFDRFYLGLLGQVGLSCDPDTFVSPETAIVRFSRQDHQDRHVGAAPEPAALRVGPVLGRHGGDAALPALPAGGGGARRR